MKTERHVLTYQEGGIRKSIALFLAIVFSLSSPVQADAVFQGMILAESMPADPIQSLDTFSIPAEWGQIVRHRQAQKDRPFIVFIQDAHAVQDAQQNIQHLIKHIRTEYGIRTVALEGSVGEIDPTLLRSFPDLFTKRKVLNQYFEKGELTGAEMASVEDTPEASYRGLEDWNLYAENFKAYQNAQSSQDEWLGRIAAVEKRLDEARQQVFSRDLDLFFGKWRRLAQEQTGLEDFIRFVMTSQPDAGPDPKNYPNLARLYELIRHSDETNHEEIDRKIRGLAEQIAKNVSEMNDKELGKEFENKNQLYNSGGLAPFEFLRYLKNFQEQSGKHAGWDSALTALLGRYEDVSALQGTVLFDELDSWAASIQKKFITGTRDAMLIKGYQDMDLIRALVRLELTRKHWALLNQVLADFGSCRRSQNALPESQSICRQFSELGPLFRGLEPFLAFYKIAEKRDVVFHRQLKQILADQRQDSAIVIAGGFHAEGFERELEKQNISYAVITPVMRSLDGHEHYGSVMTGDVSYKDDLKTTYYDGFMRHAVRELWREWSKRDVQASVKQWRDELIRLLAREGRVAEAKGYTVYLDQIHRSFSIGDNQKILDDQEVNRLRGMLKQEFDRYSKEKSRTSWQNLKLEIDRLSTGLESLIKKEGRLTSQSVAQLVAGTGQSSRASLGQVLALTQANILPVSRADRGLLPAKTLRSSVTADRATAGINAVSSSTAFERGSQYYGYFPSTIAAAVSRQWMTLLEKAAAPVTPLDPSARQVVIRNAAGKSILKVEFGRLPVEQIARRRQPLADSRPLKAESLSRRSEVRMFEHESNIAVRLPEGSLMRTPLEVGQKLLPSEVIFIKSIEPDRHDWEQLLEDALGSRWASVTGKNPSILLFTRFSQGAVEPDELPVAEPFGIGVITENNWLIRIPLIHLESEVVPPSEKEWERTFSVIRRESFRLEGFAPEWGKLFKLSSNRFEESAPLLYTSAYVSLREGEQDELKLRYIPRFFSRTFFDRDGRGEELQWHVSFDHANYIRYLKGQAPLGKTVQKEKSYDIWFADRHFSKHIGGDRIWESAPHVSPEDRFQDLSGELRDVMGQFYSAIDDVVSAENQPKLPKLGTEIPRWLYWRLAAEFRPNEIYLRMRSPLTEVGHEEEFLINTYPEHKTIVVMEKVGNSWVQFKPESPAYPFVLSVLRLAFSYRSDFGESPFMQQIPDQEGFMKALERELGRSEVRPVTDVTGQEQLSGARRSEVRPVTDVTGQEQLSGARRSEVRTQNEIVIDLGEAGTIPELDRMIKLSGLNKVHGNVIKPQIEKRLKLVTLGSGLSRQVYISQTGYPDVVFKRARQSATTRLNQMIAYPTSVAEQFRIQEKIAEIFRFDKGIDLRTYPLRFRYGGQEGQFVDFFVQRRSLLFKKTVSDLKKGIVPDEFKIKDPAVLLKILGRQVLELQPYRLWANGLFDADPTEADLGVAVDREGMPQLVPIDLTQMREIPVPLRASREEVFQFLDSIRDGTDPVWEAEPRKIRFTNAENFLLTLVKPHAAPNLRTLLLPALKDVDILDSMFTDIKKMAGHSKERAREIFREELDKNRDTYTPYVKKLAEHIHRQLHKGAGAAEVPVISPDDRFDERTALSRQLSVESSDGRSEVRADDSRNWQTKLRDAVGEWIGEEGSYFWTLDKFSNPRFPMTSREKREARRLMLTIQREVRRAYPDHPREYGFQRVLAESDTFDTFRDYLKAGLNLISRYGASPRLMFENGVQKIRGLRIEGSDLRLSPEDPEFDRFWLETPEGWVIRPRVEYPIAFRTRLDVMVKAFGKYHQALMKISKKYPGFKYGFNPVHITAYEIMFDEPVDPLGGYAMSEKARQSYAAIGIWDRFLRSALIFSQVNGNEFDVSITHKEDEHGENDGEIIISEYRTDEQVTDEDMEGDDSRSEVRPVTPVTGPEDPSGAWRSEVRVDIGQLLEPLLAQTTLQDTPNFFLKLIEGQEPMALGAAAVVLAAFLLFFPSIIENWTVDYRSRRLTRYREEIEADSWRATRYRLNFISEQIRAYYGDYKKNAKTSRLWRDGSSEAKGNVFRQARQTLTSYLEAIAVNVSADGWRGDFFRDYLLGAQLEAIQSIDLPGVRPQVRQGLQTIVQSYLDWVRERASASGFGGEIFRIFSLSGHLDYLNGLEYPDLKDRVQEAFEEISLNDSLPYDFREAARKRLKARSEVRTLDALSVAAAAEDYLSPVPAEFREAGELRGTAADYLNPVPREFRTVEAALSAVPDYFNPVPREFLRSEVRSDEDAAPEYPHLVDPGDKVFLEPWQLAKKALVIAVEDGHDPEDYEPIHHYYRISQGPNQEVVIDQTLTYGTWPGELQDRLFRDEQEKIVRGQHAKPLFKLSRIDDVISVERVAVNRGDPFILFEQPARSEVRLPQSGGETDGSSAKAAAEVRSEIPGVQDYFNPVPREIRTAGPIAYSRQLTAVSSNVRSVITGEAGLIRSLIRPEEILGWAMRDHLPTAQIAQRIARRGESNILRARARLDGALAVFLDRIIERLRAERTAGRIQNLNDVVLWFHGQEIAELQPDYLRQADPDGEILAGVRALVSGEFVGAAAGVTGAESLEAVEQLSANGLEMIQSLSIAELHEWHGRFVRAKQGASAVSAPLSSDIVNKSSVVLDAALIRAEDAVEAGKAIQSENGAGILYPIGTSHEKVAVNLSRLFDEILAIGYRASKPVNLGKIGERFSKPLVIASTDMPLVGMSPEQIRESRIDGLMADPNAVIQSNLRTADFIKLVKWMLAADTLRNQLEIRADRPLPVLPPKALSAFLRLVNEIAAFRKISTAA